MSKLLAIQTGLETTANVAGLRTDDTVTDPAVIIGSIVGVALSLVGVVFLVLMVYGGYIWMTAGGDAEKIKKAQTLIRNALIGLVIVTAGYIITSFVLEKVLEATGV